MEILVLKCKNVCESFCILTKPKIRAATAAGCVIIFLSSAACFRWFFWRNSTSNWVNFQALNSNFNSQCFSSAQYAAWQMQQQQQHLHQPQQLNWHKRNYFVERLSYATVHRCVWVEWEHAKSLFVCAKTETYRSNRTNEWLRFWQPTADHSFKMWQNKRMINLNRESTADWTRCYFSLRSCIFAFVLKCFYLHSKKNQIYIAVSVTINQKLCFILQHKVKRIGRFVVIEVGREWIVWFKGCHFQTANYFQVVLPVLTDAISFCTGQKYRSTFQFQLNFGIIFTGWISIQGDSREGSKY